jgi:hypothetical protein
MPSGGEESALCKKVEAHEITAETTPPGPYTKLILETDGGTKQRTKS